jgi:hypothetical protein
VFILLDLKSFVFNAGCLGLEVFILIGLKSFVLIQIRDILEVFILQGLRAHPLGSADSTGVSVGRSERRNVGALAAVGEGKLAGIGGDGFGTFCGHGSLGETVK